MSISAIFLSLGEATRPQALAALQEQTTPLQSIHTIDDVRPFSRAFNQGASLVQTPFFLQCDADMILEPRAVATLAAAMRPEVAVVVGYLQDPLQGAIQGVKLHRTQVALRYPLREECSCETAALQRMQGWRVEVLPPQDPLGEHRPSQSEPHTFARFLYLGRVIRLRQEASDLRLRMARLAERCQSESAAAAAAALCLGACLDPEGDGPSPSGHYAHWLQSRPHAPVERWLQSRDWESLIAACGEWLPDLSLEVREGRLQQLRAALLKRESWACLGAPTQ